MHRTKKGLHLKWEFKQQSKREIQEENLEVQQLGALNISSGSPLHLLHQLQQGLLELAADGGSLVFSGDSAAPPHVSCSLLARDLCMTQEEVRHHLDTNTDGMTYLPQVSVGGCTLRSRLSSHLVFAPGEQIQDILTDLVVVLIKELINLHTLVSSFSLWWILVFTTLYAKNACLKFTFACFEH